MEIILEKEKSAQRKHILCPLEGANTAIFRRRGSELIYQLIHWFKRLLISALTFKAVR